MQHEEFQLALLPKLETSCTDSAWCGLWYRSIMYPCRRTLTVQSMEQYVGNKSAEMNGIYVHVYEKLTKHGPLKCV